MTREEAIRHLKWIRENGHTENYLNEKGALDMAIKALEQEPCEDAISREVILLEIDKIKDNYGGLLDVAMFIRGLPSVNPQPKTGHWIEKDVVLQEDNAIAEWQSARCDKCGKYHTTPYMYYFSHYEYCPNCGAKMVGSQESEDKGL